MSNVRRNDADDLFRRLSSVLQDDEKAGRVDEVQRITQGRSYVFKQVGGRAGG